MQRDDMLENILMLGKTEGIRRRGATKDEMVGWHHQLDGHELEQTPGVGDGQESWHAAVHGITKNWTRLSN